MSGEAKKFDICCGQQDARTEEGRALCGMQEIESEDGRWVTAADHDAAVSALHAEAEALRKRARTAEREASQALRTLNGLKKVAKVVDANSDQVCGENSLLRQEVEALRAENAAALRVTQSLVASVDRAEAELEALRSQLETARGLQIAELHKLLPELDDALEDLELHGCHDQQGYRKLKDWFRKIEIQTRKLDAALAATPAPEGRHPSEGDLESAGLGYPQSKDIAVQLWHEGFRTEPIPVLEAWEAIGHDIGCNPSKQELLDSLRNMAAICEAHGNDMPKPAQHAERQQAVHWRAVLDPAEVPMQLNPHEHIAGFTDRRKAEDWIAARLCMDGWHYTLEPLYATLPPAQDVRGLVEALERAARQMWGSEANMDIEAAEIEQALATYRNPATVKRCPTCTGTCTEICAKARP